MGRKKVKLAWVENDNSRTISLRKRREGLVKKVKDVTILCDVKACIIMFSPNEVEPMVWPSVEKARDLLDGFYALPEIEKKKKETSLESYLKEKTEKVHEQLMKAHKKNMNYVTDQLMRQLHRGRRIADLNLSEIYALISFSRDNVILHRKGLHFVQYPPLRDPPVRSFEMQFEEFRTTTNDVFVRGSQEDERAGNTDEARKRINISAAVRGNQSYYLIDQWFFPSSEPPKPRTHQQIKMDEVSYNQNPNSIPYQEESINGDHNLEMEPPVGAPVITFHGLARSVSQPLQHYNINNNRSMAMSQPSQYPFDLMSREFGVKEKGSTVNNGDSQFQRSNPIEINNGVGKEPPPNEATAGEDNDDVTSIDINKVWSDINNNHS